MGRKLNSKYMRVGRIQDRVGYLSPQGRAETGDALLILMYSIRTYLVNLFETLKWPTEEFVIDVRGRNIVVTGTVLMLTNKEQDKLFDETTEKTMKVLLYKNMLVEDNLLAQNIGLVSIQDASFGNSLFLNQGSCVIRYCSYVNRPLRTMQTGEPVLQTASPEEEPGHKKSKTVGHVYRRRTVEYREAMQQELNELAKYSELSMMKMLEETMNRRMLKLCKMSKRQQIRLMLTMYVGREVMPPLHSAELALSYLVYRMQHGLVYEEALAELEEWYEETYEYDLLKESRIWQGKEELTPSARYSYQLRGMKVRTGGRMSSGEEMSSSDYSTIGVVEVSTMGLTVDEAQRNIVLRPGILGLTLWLYLERVPETLRRREEQLTAE